MKANITRVQRTATYLEKMKLQVSRELNKNKRHIRYIHRQPFFKRCSGLFMLAGLGMVSLLLSSIPTAQALGVTDTKGAVNLFIGWLQNLSKTPIPTLTAIYQLFQPIMSGNAYGLIRTVQTVITAFACTLVMIYMFMNIIREAQRGDPSMDFWTKIFVSSVVAIVAVASTSSILSSLYSAGDGLISATSSAASQSVQGKSITFNEIDNEMINMLRTRQDLITIGGKLKTKKGKEEITKDMKNPKTTAYKLMSLLSELPGGEKLPDALTGKDVDFYDIQSAASILEIMVFIGYIPILGFSFLLYSALFELFLRKMFAPMAVANIAYDGARSAGVRYLKKYFALLIRIAIYFALAAIGEMLMFKFLTQALNVAGNVEKSSLGGVVLLGLAVMSEVVAVMSMLQLGGLGDEIVGV